MSFSSQIFNSQFVGSLPMDILTTHLFPKCGAKDLIIWRIVSRAWLLLADDILRLQEKNIRQDAFDQEKWEKYFGRVEEEHRLPRKILVMLESPSPLNKDHSIAQDFRLILRPAQVNGQPLTLPYFLQLLEQPKAKEGFYVKVKQLIQDIGALENQENRQSSWMLFSKNLINRDGEQYPTYETTKQNLPSGYQGPTILDAALFIGTEYVMTGNHPFISEGVATYCQEKIRCVEKELPVAVGTRYTRPGYSFCILPVTKDRECLPGIIAVKHL